MVSCSCCTLGATYIMALDELWSKLLKGGYIRDSIVRGIFVGVIKGDTRSLDYSSDSFCYLGPCRIRLLAESFSGPVLTLMKRVTFESSVV